MTRAIFSLLLRADIRIKAVHILGMNNTLADSIIRMDQAEDYGLRQEHYLNDIQTLEVKPSINCFATQNSTKCGTYFATQDSHLGRREAAFDALLQPWNRETFPYLFPPTQLIPKVLQKIGNEKICAALVVPYWTTNSWWSSVQPLIQRTVLPGEAKDVMKIGPSMNPTLSKLPPGRLLMCLISSE
jgi:hypothetical protein